MFLFRKKNFSIEERRVMVARGLIIRMGDYNKKIFAPGVLGMFDSSQDEPPVVEESLMRACRIYNSAIAYATLENVILSQKSKEMIQEMLISNAGVGESVFKDLYLRKVKRAIEAVQDPLTAIMNYPLLIDCFFRIYDNLVSNDSKTKVIYDGTMCDALGLQDGIHGFAVDPAATIFFAKDLKDIEQLTKEIAERIRTSSI